MGKRAIIKKLTSRKFWAAIAGFVTPLILASGGSAELAAQITAMIMSGATLIAYILGEGLADAAACSEREDGEDEKPA